MKQVLPVLMLTLLALALAQAEVARFVDPAAQQARAAATERLKQIEAKFGPDASEAILPVIGLASATAASGDIEAFTPLLARANALLNRYPRHDPALGLAVLVLESDSLARQGRLRDSNDVLYKAQKLARSTTTIGLEEQANVLDRLAANEGRRGLVMRASSFNRDALKLREKLYGNDSLQYGSALLNAANWYRYSGDYARERNLEEAALVIYKEHLGQRDAQLAIPLIRMATSYTAQRTNWQEAERILQEAIGLEYTASRDDAFLRAEALASLADLRVVFGKPEDSTALYVDAWRTIGNHPQLGAPLANAYFGKVRRLFTASPDVIANIGAISLTLTVTPVGTVEDVRLVKNEVSKLDARGLYNPRSEAGSAAWQAMGRSRYRPRVVDSIPVATPDTPFSTEFCMDVNESSPTCKGKGDVSAVR
jgi:hypothetical protein